jgi:hypothetical protein
MSQPFSVEHVGEAALRVKLGVVREGVILQRGAEALRNALGIDVALTVDESLAVGWKGQAMRGPRP